ncbi:MAG: DUF1499 domain-containing protein [Leptolyngbyaceae cyanobacterium SM1_3_5]|nr:DUF1499 domain-containing protein [Leptolyngbyaceae cyanobacterium SM1_3_5]
MLVSKMTALVLVVLLWLGGSVQAIAQPFTSAELRSPAIEMSQLGVSPLFSFSGTRPANLGVKDGQLLACPGTPNCVNSQSTDPNSQTVPLTYSDSPQQAIARLKTVIEAQPRTKIIAAEDNYLYAEFTTALMGFVDDVEFYLDEAAGVIHVRSASRLGQSDLGVNRKRIETIRSQFTPS